jgi:hypothetical protein
MVVGLLLLGTAGYATAAGALHVIRLHAGESVRVGNLKVVAVGPARPVTIRRTVTSPPETVTQSMTVTGPTTTVTKTSTISVPVPGPIVTVTVTATTSSTPTPPSGPKTSFGDGTYRVNTDIVPGTYRAPGGSSCYWARLKGFSGSLDDILANGFGDTSPIVTISASDAGFESSHCGTWAP